MVRVWRVRGNAIGLHPGSCWFGGTRAGTRPAPMVALIEGNKGRHEACPHGGVDWEEQGQARGLPLRWL